jgi:hypothetical protein
MRSITEAARVIRSKNSGPYELTMDIMFKDRKTYEIFRDGKLIDKRLIKRLYKVSDEDIMGIIWFEPANAVKITIRRKIASGAPEDTDIYGAQQHAPLLGIMFDDTALG